MSETATRLSKDAVQNLIRRLYLRIGRPKAELNTHRRVNYLPSKILATIFQIIVDEWSSAIEAKDNGFDLSYDWIRITHVCSHWRNVAIWTSTLWTCIVLHKFELVNLLLQRSRGSALTLLCWDGLVIFDQHREQWLRMLDRLSPHLPRVERVQIIFRPPTPSTILPILNPLFSCHIPSIQFLLLNNLYPSLTEIGRNVAQQQPYPSDIPSRSQLINVDAFKTMVGNDLRHLSMTYVAYHNLETFLTVLTKTPRLETLVCVGSPSRPLEASPFRVALPRLRSLKLELGTLQALSILLQHLSYPTTAMVNLEYDALPSPLPTRQIDNNVGTYLRQLIPEPSSLTISPNPNDLTLQSANLTLRAILPRNRQSIFIKRLFTRGVTGALHHLSLGSGIDAFQHNEWESIGNYETIQKGACDLQSLVVPSVYHLSSLLLPNTPYKDTAVVGTIHSIPFPKLKRLYILKTANRDSQLLCDVLAARKQLGNVLDEICMPYADDHSEYRPIARLVRNVYTRL